MSGELSYFRKRFFGGFNRQDVVDYVAKLAKERNELRIAKDKAIEDTQSLNDEIATLRLELDEARQEASRYKTEALESAIKTFSVLEADFVYLRKELESAADGVRAELESACGTIAAVPTVLERAEVRVAELRATLAAEKEAVAGITEH